MSKPQPHDVSLVYKMESPERDLGSDQTRLRQLNFAVQAGIDTIRFDFHQSLNEAGFLIECGHLLVHPGQLDVVQSCVQNDLLPGILQLKLRRQQSFPGGVDVTGLGKGKGQ